MDNDLVVCSNVGTEKQKIFVGKLFELLDKEILLPACIVVPANLHFLEEKSLKKFKNN